MESEKYVFIVGGNLGCDKCCFWMAQKCEVKQLTYVRPCWTWPKAGIFSTC